ncbi:MAG: DUF4037 domain-containing protein [Desulfovibrio sp.]|nr:DUF4037 domain-containing protein [Desulfovibrio sp.]
MNGLELARAFYAACRPALAAAIPDIMARGAAGLAGEGSECLGLDDATSQDHDFGAAFCLWLPREVLREQRERIEAAFAALPTEFAGHPSRLLPGARQGRVGPLSVEGFYNFFTGLDAAPETWRQWLAIPEHNLAAATNGEVFEDAGGRFTAWREALLAYYPRDVWLKKLAACAMLTAQAGQYNLPRALGRGDGPSAMLAAARFAEAALGLVFLLNRRYMPFYKWAPRLGRRLPVLGASLGRLLDALAAHPLRGPEDMDVVEAVELFCTEAAEQLRFTGLSDVADSWLWAHGPRIMARVKDAEIRRLNLLDTGPVAQDAKEARHAAESPEAAVREGLDLLRGGNARQAATALEAAAASLKDTPEQTRLRALALDGLGRARMALGDAAGSIAALGEGAELAAGGGGALLPLQCGLLQNLCFALSESGATEESAAVGAEAAKLAEKLHGPQSPELAGALLLLSAAPYRARDFAAAEALILRARAIWEAQPGPAPQQVGTCLNNLGRIHEELGDMAGGIAFHREAVAFRRTQADKGDLAFSLGNLGVALAQDGQWREAAAALEEALAIYAAIGKGRSREAKGYAANLDVCRRALRAESNS